MTVTSIYDTLEVRLETCCGEGSFSEFSACCFAFRDHLFVCEPPLLPAPCSRLARAAVAVAVAVAGDLSRSRRHGTGMVLTLTARRRAGTCRLEGSRHRKNGSSLIRGSGGSGGSGRPGTGTRTGRGTHPGEHRAFSFHLPARGIHRSREEPGQRLASGWLVFAS